MKVILLNEIIDTALIQMISEVKEDFYTYADGLRESSIFSNGYCFYITFFNKKKRYLVRHPDWNGKGKTEAGKQDMEKVRNELAVYWKESQGEIPKISIA